jgi:hypothetical protein
MTRVPSSADAHDWEEPFARLRAPRGWVLRAGPRWLRVDGFVAWRESSEGRWRAARPDGAELGPPAGFSASGDALDYIDALAPRPEPPPGE